jgi:polar amino acid transport system substrate-binding protein
VLVSADVHAVFVLSRHDSHANYVISALTNHKPVFVEKPLALNAEELNAIAAAYRYEQSDGHSPFLMVGFNRRFSPATEKIRDFFAGRREPAVVHIRVNAGHLPHEHWTQQNNSGGRIVGEACHFLDWARAVVGTKIVAVQAMATPDLARYSRDNVAIMVSFADGSIANILYLANGDKSVPKEFYEVFCEGAVARLNDFRSLDLHRSGKRSRSSCNRDKGHNIELERTVRAMRNGESSPIPFDDLVEVTRASHAVLDSLSFGTTVSL